MSKVLQFKPCKCFQELFLAGCITYVLNRVKITQAVTPAKESLQVQFGGRGAHSKALPLY